MTQEEKDLLLKDLCARLPYKTKVHKHWMYRETDGSLNEKETDGVLGINDFYAIWEIKPYLRPMSSMTEKENEELKYEIELELRALEGEDGHNIVSAAPAAFEIDFYNKHHIDYRGLIPKGLALEAPEGMYKM